MGIFPKHDGLRKPNWEEAFNDFILDAKHRQPQLDWENITCASWVGDAVLGITGTDFVGQFRDVSSPYTAAKAVRDAGFESIEQVMDQMFEVKGVAFATRGDIVLVPSEEGNNEPALALADPPFYWGLGTSGLCQGDLLTAFKAYKV